MADTASIVDPSQIINEFLVANPGHGVSTTLDGALTAASSSIPVVAGTAFPSNGPFAVLVDSEVFMVTRSGNTLTLYGKRGAFATTAAVHSSGAAIHLAVLYDLTGAQVWEGRLKKGFANDSPAIKYDTISAAPHWNATDKTGSITFVIFPGSSSVNEARTIAGLLETRLHSAVNQSVTNGTLCRAELEVSNPLPYDEETGQYLYMATYNYMVGE